jgi:hypothetical protein
LLVGELGHLVGRTEQIVIGVKNGFEIDDVDLPLEFVFRTHRDEDGVRVRSELGADIFDDGSEVGTDAIHLVHKNDAGNSVFVRLAPDRLGLGLHAGHSAENDDGTIKNTERALDLGREIHVTGSVNDVNTLLLAEVRFINTRFFTLHPLAGDGGGGDRDAAGPLLLHPVGRRLSVVDFADLVDHARVKQNPLSKGGLPRINVRGNPDVAGPLKRKRAIRRVRTNTHLTGCGNSL